MESRYVPREFKRRWVRAQQKKGQFNRNRTFTVLIGAATIEHDNAEHIIRQNPDMTIETAVKYDVEIFRAYGGREILAAPLQNLLALVTPDKSKHYAEGVDAISEEKSRFLRYGAFQIKANDRGDNSRDNAPKHFSLQSRLGNLWKNLYRASAIKSDLFPQTLRDGFEDAVRMFMQRPISTGYVPVIAGFGNLISRSVDESDDIVAHVREEERLYEQRLEVLGGPGAGKDFRDFMIGARGRFNLFGDAYKGDEWMRDSGKSIRDNERVSKLSGMLGDEVARWDVPREKAGRFSWGLC